MRSKELEIAARLLKNVPYNKIAKELRVSAKTIAKVKRLIDSGEISIDKKGKVSFVERQNGEEKEALQIGYRLMRALGCSNLKEALTVAYNFAAKINPYLLYYNVKTPADLITHLENKIQELQRKNEKLENLDEISLGLKLGLNDKTLAGYIFLKQYKGFSGSLADFLNICVQDIFRIYGYELEETPPDEDGKKRFYIRVLNYPY